MEAQNPTLPDETAPTEAEVGEEPDALVRFGVSMPAQLVHDLDAWRKQRGYTSRSEAVRDLVRDALVESRWQAENADPEAEVVAIVTLVYQHTTRQISEHLTQIQHHHHATAQTSLHIHLSPENCLEVIVLRGRRTEVLEMAHHLMSARGVLHSKFVPTTTGEGLE
jgi:CopG family nickel-responsive transcriptional regulator